MMGELIYTLKVGKSFLKMSQNPEPWKIKKKINKVKFLNPDFLFCKTTINKIKRKMTN